MKSKKELDKTTKVRQDRGLRYLLAKIAPLIGAKVLIEPEWGIVGMIVFKNGRHSFFRYSTLDLNAMGASEISRDKDYANFFMAQMGYPIIPGSKAFYSKYWVEVVGAQNRGIDDAYQHAKQLSFPVIVKPNGASQGIGVTLVYNRHEFYKTMRALFKHNNIVLVQQPVIGKDYRVVVLDEEIISAYERIPLSVTGDGKLTIFQLLELKQEQFIKDDRDTKIKSDDPRIFNKLKHQKLTFDSILKPGEKVFLLDNANLSSGGDSLDITNQMHPKFKELAIKLTRDMGLRFCGVDLMIEGDITQEPNKYWVIEINSAPGLDHYAKIGEEQQIIVEALYLKVLKHLERE